jgi:hypothetical protein
MESCTFRILIDSYKPILAFKNEFQKAFKNCLKFFLSQIFY